MTVRIFEHIDIASWRGIDQMWMFFEQVLKEPALTNSSNTVISCIYIVG